MINIEIENFATILEETERSFMDLDENSKAITGHEKHRNILAVFLAISLPLILYYVFSRISSFINFWIFF